MNELLLSNSYLITFYCFFSSKKTDFFLASLIQILCSSFAALIFIEEMAFTFVTLIGFASVKIKLFHKKSTKLKMNLDFDDSIDVFTFQLVVAAAASSSLWLVSKFSVILLMTSCYHQNLLQLISKSYNFSQNSFDLLNCVKKK